MTRLLFQHHKPSSVGPERLARTSGILFSLIIPAISLARYASSLARHVTLPLPALGHPDLDPAWIEPILSYFHGPLGYYSTLTRATNFLVGALLGLLVLDPGRWAALRRRRGAWAAVSLAALAAWAALVPLRRPFLAPPDRATAQAWPARASAVWAALGYHASLPVSFLVATGLAALMLFPRAAPARALGRLSPLEPYTFHAFLLHIPVMYWAEAWLAPRGALLRLTLAAPLAGLAALVLAVWCASLAAAAALGALERAVLQPALSRTLAVVGW